ncbi:MAG: Rieske (2Fe-2S) protein [Caldilineaceae bacterium]|nr:Rieske (2Fe-2S) protein [Caldilineaceae bacterium]
MRTGAAGHFVNVASLAQLKSAQCLTVHAGGHVLALFLHNDRVYAVDNRCPHMGFPLDKGSVHGGILTCHWHHARFDLASGGAFDQFADDVRAFPTEVRAADDGEQIWVDIGSAVDEYTRQRDRLAVGLERDIPLVLGKAALTLMEEGRDPVEPFRMGLTFGARYRQQGWGQGLTMHVCMMNLLPHLDAEDRPRAMYHGLSAVARDSAGHPPRFTVRPLPENESSADGAAYIGQLKNWFRQFIEVRDAEGAERCIVSAVRAGATSVQMADMLFAAVTDHRYIDIGHPADFTNKAFEALDIAGWENAELVLTSLVAGYANAARMEESNAWRHPIDLIEILDGAFAQLETVAPKGASQPDAWHNGAALSQILLQDDPFAIVNALLDALRSGCTMTQLAETVVYAAALRVARFHTSNEFGDWDTALHTFTFANAVQQGLRRAPSVELLRGVFDAAMSIYLDRFLNLPAARLPEANVNGQSPDTVLAELIPLLDRQQQVNPAARLVAKYLYGGGEPKRMQATLGKLLLREDRDFHTIQSVEAAFRVYDLLRGQPEAVNVLVAAARYLAAHSPTVRAQGQTYQIAQRLHRGDNLFIEEE